MISLRCGLCQKIRGRGHPLKEHFSSASVVLAENQTGEFVMLTNLMPPKRKSWLSEKEKIHIAKYRLLINLFTLSLVILIQIKEENILKMVNYLTKTVVANASLLQTLKERKGHTKKKTNEARSGALAPYPYPYPSPLFSSSLLVRLSGGINYHGFQ